jgi:hypothetical protein
MVKKQVEYSRKTVTTLLRDLPAEVSAEIHKAGMFAALIWNLAFDQCEYWLGLPKGDPNKKALTPFSMNYWLPTVADTVITLPSGEQLPTGDLSSYMRREVCRMLAGAWQSYFELSKKKDKEARAPRKKSEGWFQTMAWPNPKVKTENGVSCFVLPVAKGWKIEIPFDRHLNSALEGKEIKEMKVSRVRRGQSEEFCYKLSVVYAYYPPKPTEVPTLMRAVDLGAGDMAVCDSTGVSYLVPMRRPDKFWMKQIGDVEKRLESCKKGSRAWKRRMKARQRMHNRSGDQKTDFQRKLALSLVAKRLRDDNGKVVKWERTCDIIVIGESKVRLGLAKSDNGVAKQHFGVQNTGYMDRLTRFIEEKAIEFGVLVVKVPDPPRSGNLADKTQKLGAAALLLRKVGKEYGVSVHEGAFTLKSQFSA